MNQNILEQWTEALYSEDYTQGIRTLRSYDNTFCCLGVLCDLYVKSDHGQWTLRSNDTYALGGESSILPEKVAQWAGLHSTSPEVTYNEESIEIVELNDEKGLDFKTIADALLRTYSAP